MAKKECEPAAVGPALLRPASLGGLPDLVVERAHSATLHLTSGASLLDFSTGGFGYGHPEIRRTLSSQVHKLPLSSRVFFSEPLAALCVELARRSPGHTAIYPCNTADEALDGAVKLAKGYSRGRSKIVTIGAAGHGRTLYLSQFSKTQSQFGHPFGVRDGLEALIDDDTAAVIVEPLSTAGEVTSPPPAYFETLRNICTSSRAVLIADERVTGLGMTGTFCASVGNLAPDVLVLGDTLGGGVFPCAAYMARDQINTAVYKRKDPVLHATTTGANPSACAVALSALGQIESLTDKVCSWGKVLGDHLNGMRYAAPDLIEHVSGKGLIWSITLRDTSIADALHAGCLRQGVLLRREAWWPQVNVVQLRLALMTDEQELLSGIWKIANAFMEMLDGDGHEAP